MKVIWDTFCGAGGFSLGFASKDNYLIGFDLDEIALKTYKHNISKVSGKVNVVKCDLSKMHLIRLEGKFAVFLYHHELLDIIYGCYFWRSVVIKIPKPDILIGSPPCQDFSIANRFKQFNTILVEKFLDFKNKLKPKFWVMEEVPQVGKIGKKNGWFEPRYLKAIEFNLPHRRKRLFAGNYPNPIKKPWRGMKIYTPRGRKPGKGWDGWDKKLKKQTGTDVIPTWKKFLKNSNFLEEKYQEFINGEMLFNTPQAQIRGYGHGKEARKKIIKQFMILQMILGKNIINTPRTKGDFGDFDDNRKIIGTEIVTPELYSWIMGFPLDYEFKGKKSDVYRQIGNAVCPPISRAIYDAILREKKPRPKQTSLLGFVEKSECIEIIKKIKN